MNFREIKDAVKSSLDVAIKTTLEETINNLDLNLKEKEASLFRELSDYFTKRTSYIEDATVEKVSSLLQDDILNYSHLSKVCDYKKDRGAQRVCVWGEKVTRMLSSLVTRYLQEGEEMLKDESIWLCTICGFIYIGKNPPELCPVCKVPSYKFEKVEGGR